MKVTFATTVVAASALAAADTIYFSVNDAVTNKQLGTLYDAHEIAGGNFFFLGGTPNFYNFDPASKSVSFTSGGLPYKLGSATLMSNTFWGMMTIVGGPGVPLNTDANNKVTNNYFWACKNVNDPYKYSVNNAAILINNVGNLTAPAPSCTRVHIYKNTVASPTGNNGTWTSYTTYCPLPTVVTITSCDTVCYPTAITVTTATTITCANCVVPVTTVTVAPGTTTTAASTGRASSSTVASVSTITYTGAGVKAAMGAGAGAVAAAAALLL